MKVLITGSSGLIGAAAVDYFAAVGSTVLGTDVIPPRRREHGPVFAQCDLLDRERLREVVVGFNPHWLIHLGARTDTYEKRSLSGYAANIEGVRNVLEVSNGCSELKRMIITSSRLVCRVGYMPRSEDDYCPPNYYGQSKVETERITRSFATKTEWILTRPTAIWGPGFLVPSYREFFEQIRLGRYFHLGKTRILKTFGYVGNCVFQMHKLLEAPSESVAGRLFYLGDYEPVAIREWADMIAREFGNGANREIPLGVLRLGAAVGSALRALGWNGCPLTTYRLRNMLCDAVHPMPELQRITGPLPYGLEEATRLTVRWLKENPR